MKKLSLLSLFAFALSAASLVVAAKLPYRTADLRRATDLSEPPAADGGFRFGHLTWDTAFYAQEPRLEPLRAFFREHCASASGSDAAVCVSDVFARAFRADSPKRELFDPVYDPVADLAIHMQGEPGHCVTRSGLITAILLSVGIPARVVQFHAATGVGHNVLSVWDRARGWVIFDPSFGSFAALDGKPVGVAELVARPQELVALSAGLVPEGSGHTAREYYGTIAAPGLTVIVPEPWLYMRVGDHIAPWPLRGSFAVTGARPFRLGPAQDISRGGFLLFGLLGIGAGLTARARRARLSAAPAAPPAAGLEPAE